MALRTLLGLCLLAGAAGALALIILLLNVGVIMGIGVLVREADGVRRVSVPPRATSSRRNR